MSKKLLKVGLITDHSVSMSSRTKAAMEDFNRTIEQLKAASTNLKIEVTHIKCGVSWLGTTTNITECVSRSIDFVSPMFSYEASGGNTPLFDAVSKMLNTIGDDGVSPVLISIVTDGQDNASSISGHVVAQKIRKLQETDRWTVAFSVPKGYKSGLISNGFEAGNIQEWELSSQGMETASIARSASFAAYTTSVATNTYSSTNKFYTDLSNVNQTIIKSNLVDISQQVIIFPVSGAEGQQIRTFVESKINKKMKTGSAFYQLVKSEAVVQPNKLIMVRDKTTNAIYSGDAVRDLLNLPRVGNIKLVPGNHGNYDLFIQSTSVNRKLDANTQLIYWEDFTNNPVGFVTIQPKQVVAKPVQKQVDPISQVLANVTPTSNNQNLSMGAIDAYLKAIQTHIPDVKPAKPVAKKVAAKKTTKKRVRNRWTLEEYVRRFVLENARNMIPVKKLTNKIDITGTLGYNLIDLLTLSTLINKKFCVNISSADLVKCKLVGDIVDLVVAAEQSK